MIVSSSIPHSSKIFFTAKGCTIYVRKVAPLGDPVEITLRGYELSLRKSEAEKVEVE